MNTQKLSNVCGNYFEKGNLLHITLYILCPLDTFVGCKEKAVVGVKTPQYIGYIFSMFQA